MKQARIEPQGTSRNTRPRYDSESAPLPHLSPGNMPTVHSRNPAELIRQLQTETERLKRSRQVYFPTEQSRDIRFPFAASPYQSPIELKALTPYNSLRPVGDVFIRPQAAGAPQLVQAIPATNSKWLQLPPEIWQAILQFVNRKSLRRFDSTCKVLNQLASSQLAARTRPYFKVRPYFTQALPGEFSLDLISTAEKYKAHILRGAHDTECIFTKIGLRTETVFATTGDLQRNYLGCLQPGNKIRNVRLSLRPTSNYGSFLAKCDASNLGKDCSIELILDESLACGPDDVGRLSIRGQRLPVRSLSLSLDCHLHMLADERFDQIKRLAFGHYFRLPNGFALSRLTRWFPAVEELALTTTQWLPAYLRALPNIHTLSISRRFDYNQTDNQFDLSSVGAISLQTLHLDGFNFDEGELLSIAASPAKFSLQSFYLVDCDVFSSEELKKLLPQLPALTNLILAKLDTCIDFDLSEALELARWAAVALPGLSVQVI